MNGTVSADMPPKKLSPMENEMGSMTNAIGELRLTVQTLRERLSPISSLRTPTNEKDKLGSPTSASMLVNTMRQYKNQIDEIRAQVQEIMAHVEI